MSAWCSRPNQRIAKRDEARERVAQQCIIMRHTSRAATSAIAAMRYVGDTSERLLVRLPLREGRYHSLQVPTRYHRRLRREACASMLVTELHSVVDLVGQERTQPPFCMRWRFAGFAGCGVLERTFWAVVCRGQRARFIERGSSAHRCC